MEPSDIPRPFSGRLQCRPVWLVALVFVIGLQGLDTAARRREAPPAATLAGTCAVRRMPVPTPPAPPPIDPAISRHANRTRHLYRPIIRRVAARYAVDPALVQAIIMAESAYDPRAVSRRGALGLMQLMPATAESLGVTDSFDPEHNIAAGVRYFRHLMDRCDGDATLALAAYNAGLRKVRLHRGVPPIKATRRYVRKVMAYYQCYRRLGQGREA